MIELRERTRDNVEVYWNKIQDDEINRLFPRSVNSLEESLILFEKSKNVGAKSFGMTIYNDDLYIGDVWVYAIDQSEEKMAMLSIVIFDKRYWGQGIGTYVISDFCKKCFDKYEIDKIGAFVYASNVRSINALQRSGFKKIENFIEQGIESSYYELFNKYGSIKSV